MTPERWHQVEEIFQAALDLVPEQRVRYLSEVCPGDADLRRDVEALLAQHESAGDLLEQPLYGETDLNVLSAIESIATDDEVDPMIGRRLGVYRIAHPVQLGLVLLPHLLEFALKLRNVLRGGGEGKQDCGDQAGADRGRPGPASRT